MSPASLLISIRQLSTCFILIVIATILPVWVNTAESCSKDKDCPNLMYCPVAVCEDCSGGKTNNTKCNDEVGEVLLGALTIVAIVVVIAVIITCICVTLCCLCCAGCPGHTRRMARGGIGYGGGGGWARPNANAEDTAAAPTSFSQQGTEPQNLDSGASAAGAGNGTAN